MLNNSPNTYGWLAIFFHWTTALTVFGLFAVGYWMVDLNYYSEWYRTAPHYHKSIGILLALLTVARLVWKYRSVTPSALGNKREVLAAKFAHVLLYTLPIALYISGFLISTADGRGIEVFNWFTLPSFGEVFENQEDLAGTVHEWLAYALISFALLHAIAAVKHHVIDKDSTLKRMIKPIK